MPKLLTTEMKDRFFSILNLPDQFQLDCKNAFDYFRDNPNEMKFRRKHDPQNPQDPSPSFIFKEGKIYALARNVLGEGTFGRVKLLLEIVQNADQSFSPGDVTVVKIERGEETEKQKFEHQVASKLGIAIGEKQSRKVDKVDKNNQPYKKKVYSQLEYLGTDLARYMEVTDAAGAQTELAREKKLDMAIRLCKAVNGFHQQGYVHNDIKPDNFTIDADEVHLIDYGLANLGAERVNDHGSPLYMLGYDYMDRNRSLLQVRVSLKQLKDGYEKDVIALKKTLYIASPFNRIHDKVNNKYIKYSLFTESEFKGFSKTLQDSLKTTPPSEYLANSPDHKPLMLAALLVVEKYLSQTMGARTIIDQNILRLNADEQTLNAIVNVHLSLQPDDNKRAVLATFFSCVNFIRMIVFTEQSKGVQTDNQEKAMMQTTRDALTTLDLSALKNIETKLTTLYGEVISPSLSGKKMGFFDNPSVTPTSSADSVEPQPLPDITTPNSPSK